MAESEAIEEEPPTPNTADDKKPLLPAPEVEVRLYRQGRGPVAVFQSKLGGYDQDQLEVQDILDRYNFKSIFVFDPAKGRGVPVRFNSRNGRSLLSYHHGSTVVVDGEPKDSKVKPVTKIMVTIAVMTIIVAVLYKEPPEWLKASRFSTSTFPPWVLACGVIVFTRLRKRTKDVLKKFGY